MSAGLQPIRTPFFRLLMLWRQRYLPFAIWGLAVLLASGLLQRQYVFVNAIGHVESETAYVAPLIDGVVQGIAVDVLDRVEVGQVVVTMDDSLILSELKMAEAEVDLVRASLDAEMLRFNQEQKQLEASLQNDLRRFLLNEEEARLNYLDRVIDHETDKANLERLGVQLRRQDEMRKQSVLDNATYDETRLAHAALKTKVEKDVDAIALAKKNIETAALRLEEVQTPESLMTATDAIVRELQADIATQQAYVDEVQARRRALVLKAPVSGQVAVINRRQGELIIAGDPILTIIGGDGARIIAYMDERAAVRLQTGDSVEIHTRTRPTTVVQGTILKVGNNVEPYPIRLLLDPMIPEYGVQVLVGELPENTFRPGEALNLRLRAAS